MSIPSPLFNCQQATLFIERPADEVLPPKTQVQFWAHLRLCPYCRRYSVQSPFVARQAKAACSNCWTPPAGPGPPGSEPGGASIQAFAAPRHPQPKADAHGVAKLLRRGLRRPG